MKYPTIYETQNFIVEAHQKPFVSREEGGHIRIRVKDESIEDRAKLPANIAIEYMKLSMVTGEAFEKVMNEQGVPVVKINYQDMGNWAYKEGKRPFLHYHIFGRVLGARCQPYPESVYLPDRSSGFYDSFIPLTQEDAIKVNAEMDNLIQTDKYRNFSSL
jgi:diadenosine tetraphosphate (Ap4A) HIT family hydrolase